MIQPKQLMNGVMFLGVCAVLGLFIFTACDRSTLKASGYIEYYDGVVEIDSCQYLQISAYYGYKNYVHKGNCKYCIERNKKDSIR